MTPGGREQGVWSSPPSGGLASAGVCEGPVGVPLERVGLQGQSLSLSEDASSQVTRGGHRLGKA